MPHINPFFIYLKWGIDRFPAQQVATDMIGMVLFDMFLMIRSGKKMAPIA